LNPNLREPEETMAITKTSTRNVDVPALVDKLCPRLSDHERMLAIEAFEATQKLRKRGLSRAEKEAAKRTAQQMPKAATVVLLDRLVDLADGLGKRVGVESK
jgi:hypothetical protein